MSSPIRAVPRFNQAHSAPQSGVIPFLSSVADPAYLHVGEDRPTERAFSPTELTSRDELLAKLDAEWEELTAKRSEAEAAQKEHGTELAPVIPIAEPPRTMSREELFAFAKFFAAQFGYQSGEANERGAIWYQDEVGAYLCSLNDAAKMRQMTIEHCRWVASGHSVAGAKVYDQNRIVLPVAPYRAWLPNGTAARKRLDGFALVTFGMLLLLLGGMIWKRETARPVPTPADIQGAR